MKTTSKNTWQYKSIAPDPGNAFFKTFQYWL